MRKSTFRKRVVCVSSQDDFLFYFSHSYPHCLLKTEIQIHLYIWSPQYIFNPYYAPRNTLGIGGESKKQNRSHGILILLGRDTAVLFIDPISMSTISDDCHNVSNDPCVVKLQGHVSMNFKSCYTQKEALLISSEHNQKIWSLTLNVLLLMT